MENLTQDRPIALLAGFDAVTAEVCRRRLEGEVRVLTAGSEEEALQILAERPVAALCLGAGFPEGSALDLLEKAAEVSAAEAAESGSTWSSRAVRISPPSRTGSIRTASST